MHSFKKRVQLDGITNAERAFVFKLFLCNPFARSAGIFLQFTPLTIKGYTVFRVPRVTRLPILSTRCQGYTILKNASPGCQSFQRAFRVTNFKKRVELDGITNAERAFVFKLFLCNPFARSAGIFLTCLRAFTRFYTLLRGFTRFYLS